MKVEAIVRDHFFRSLLDPACKPPDVTAVLAGTVDAIYIHVESAVEMEIGHEMSVRQLILEAQLYNLVQQRIRVHQQQRASARG